MRVYGWREPVVRRSVIGMVGVSVEVVVVVTGGLGVAEGVMLRESE